jgi:4-diphosphocytidyl-2-C-methyl-D-erythritol kinase
MSRPLTVPAPAKVNLLLRVMGKRPDGFHELDTLFEAIDAHDTLSFSSRPSGVRLTTDHSTLPTGPKNLVVRAAELLRAECGIRSGVRIHLKKELPVASGLGGGSSDAATTLLALNRFWKLGLKQGALIRLAAKLGSDIPFFILESSYAVGNGRGEVLTAVPSRLKLWHVLVTPRLHVLAKDVYGRMEPGWLKPRGTDARMLAARIKKGDRNFVGRNLFNSLQAAVLALHPSLDKIRQDLTAAGASAAIVSGSGPTVFGLTESRASALKLAAAMRRRHPSKRVFTACTASF